MKDSNFTSPTTNNRGPIATFVIQFQVVVVVALIVATLFTAWSPLRLITGSAKPSDTAGFRPIPTQESEEATPEPLDRPRIAIVAGHWGNDSGAACSDGLTELDINLAVATLVKENLQKEGLDVELLNEFDSKLDNYFASVLVSIHSDSCEYVNEQATGFKVAPALGTRQTRKANAERLSSCLRQRYGERSGLAWHNSITPDMTLYHAFDEIHPDTTAAIIELGFMNLDRQVLTQNQPALAQGVTDGILCYLRNENINPEN